MNILVLLIYFTYFSIRKDVNIFSCIIHCSQSPKCITKTHLYNFYPLKLHFYRAKQGYTLFSLFLLKNIDCGYSLESPRWDGSNDYLQSMFWAEIWKTSDFFYLKIFIFFFFFFFFFFVMKFSIYLKRRVFVMERELIFGGEIINLRRFSFHFWNLYGFLVHTEYVFQGCIIIPHVKIKVLSPKNAWSVLV